MFVSCSGTKRKIGSSRSATLDELVELAACRQAHGASLRAKRSNPGTCAAWIASAYAKASADWGPTRRSLLTAEVRLLTKAVGEDGSSLSLLAMTSVSSTSSQGNALRLLRPTGSQKSGLIVKIPVPLRSA